MLNKFSGVHPYVADRVRAILDVVDRYGGKYTVTSGVRSTQKQFELYVDYLYGGNLAALPGCSQHEYGFAMDVFFPDPRWASWFGAVAAHIGLVEIKSDPGHVQVWPGNKFRELLRPYDLCPDPNYNQALGRAITHSAAVRECAAEQGRTHFFTPEACLYLG